MLRNLLLTIGIILTANVLVFSQATNGTLKGKVIDKVTKEPLPFVNIVVELGGEQVNGATTDFDGNYLIKPIEAGKYDVKASYVGYKPLMIRGVAIFGNQIRFMDIQMESTAEQLDVVEIIDYEVPLISKDQTQSGGTVTKDDIDKMPNRSVDGIAATVGGVFSRDGERGNVRGAREDGTIYFIDGMRVRGSRALPQSAIEQQTVILGGLPAQYGDATGGIIEVTTRGPSRKFGLGAELETSQFLDAFGYNRVGLNLNGPIFSKKDEQGNKTNALLGYFIAGDFIHRQDGNPSTNLHGLYKSKDEYREFLEQNPLRPSGLGTGTYLNGNYAGYDQFETIKKTQNTQNYSVNVNAKIDVRTTETINLTFGGTFAYNQGNAYSYGNSMFNYNRNSQFTNYTWRVFGRFSQRFPTASDSRSFVKNVYYSIQADYTQNYGYNQDPDHKDDLFKYGYVGQFDVYKDKNYTLGSDTINGEIFNNVWIMDNIFDTLWQFNRREINPFIANVTDDIYDIYPTNDFHRTADDIQSLGGKLNGQGPDGIYGMWNSPGAVANNYNVFDNTQLSIGASGSMDLGNHEIKFGFQYEQRMDRSYGYGPSGLWNLMRGNTNWQIRELDLDNPMPVYRDGVFMDTIEYARRYDPNVQFWFDKELRKKLGLPLDGLDYIQIDSYDYNNHSITYFDAANIPHTITLDSDLFDINMFSPDELLNDGNFYVFYRGYDHTGKKISSNPTFEDFWNQQDENGNYTRPIAAWEPIYMAGFLQDKFAFNDLIFNVGLRVDRYDANQPVLADPYLFYTAYNSGDPATGELVSKMGGNYSVPGNIGSDYTVYVDNASNPTFITGYRDESTWFTAEGTEIQDPNILDVGSGVSPYLKNPNSPTTELAAFQDYEPQVNVMPRISFSFPISDVALFFAHYDVLTQRPTQSSWSDPRVYYYFNSITNTINNPNLKPTKTIDYELGFQQKLTNSSSLKLSVFYREMRDMIQIYRFNGAYPKDYTSFNNIDFGITKGMTITYDLRRTNNARITAYYTLQFSDGTGSSSTTAAALVNAGLPNLRTEFPLAWDRRHQFNIFFDYHYSEGKDYNGPLIQRRKSGKSPVQLLKNTGVTFTINGGSGVPYTRSRNIYSQLGGGTRLLRGTYNGSRLPWQFRIDFVADKDITFNIGKGENQRRGYLNIYFRINNLLNQKNVMNVYPATGNPDDDGYLAAAEWQREINDQIDPQSFRDQYTIFIDSPFNYSNPRTIRFGLIFSF